VNAKGFGGMSPLLLAVSNTEDDISPSKYKDVVALIIAEGGNINAKNDVGDTPLHVATLRANKDVVELLLTKGSEVNAKTDLGETPLDFFIDKINPAIDQALLSKYGKEQFEETKKKRLLRKSLATLLRKNGGKTGEELKASGN
tara:strand:+ start:287 stop:718 length:432 start_codon:yes stop_codon:yes gene_type:complete